MSKNIAQFKCIFFKSTSVSLSAGVFIMHSKIDSYSEKSKTGLRV